MVVCLWSAVSAPYWIWLDVFEVCNIVFTLVSFLVL